MLLVRSIIAAGIVAASPLVQTVDASSPRGAPGVHAWPRVLRDTGSQRLDSSLALATFDSAWRTVGASLSGRGVTRIDWPAVRTELRPRAARASSERALRAVIDDMLRRLGESHFAILPAASGTTPTSGAAGGATLGTSGILVRVVNHQLIVWRADTAGPGWRAGVSPGWTIDRIGSFVVPRLGAADATGLKRLTIVSGAANALRGAPGSRVRVIGRDNAGVDREVSFLLDSISGPVSQFGNLPPLPASVQLTRRSLSDGRCVGVIRFEYWMPPVMPALDRAVDSVRMCSGVVLDLRGNLGGVAGMMMGAAGHFLTEPRTLGTMRTRGEEMRFVANPRRATETGATVEPFAGPLAILVDGLSASTSEMFAAGLQALGRARIFGEPTAGQALPAMATKLPNGDVLMHVVADFVAPDGARIEGKGVIPDELIWLTRSDAAARRDAPLDAAVRWMERAGQDRRQ